MAKRLKQNTVRKNSAPSNPALMTLSAGVGDEIVDIRMAANHVESSKGRFLEITLLADAGNRKLFRRFYIFKGPR